MRSRRLPRFPGARTLFGSLVILATSASAAGATGPATSLDAPVDTGTIRVSVQASVPVEADRVRLRFAVENEASEASAAAEANAAAITRAITAVREAAGEGHEIETRGYTLHPVYDERRLPGEARREVVGFRAVNTLVVTLRELDRVGPTLDAAVGGGANRIDGIQLFASDTRAPYLEALDRAVANALEEARVMANATGGALGEVLEVSAGSGGGQPFRTMAVSDMQEVGTPIEPGALTVSASVTLLVRLAAR